MFPSRDLMQADLELNGRGYQTFPREIDWILFVFLDIGDNDPVNRGIQHLLSGSKCRVLSYYTIRSQDLPVEI
jgi:hypothetical protein